MDKYISFCSLFLLTLLSSCVSNPVLITPRSPDNISDSVTPIYTPGSPTNRAEYAAPTYTPRPIPTPLPKSQSGELTLLLRKRVAPYEEVILRLPSDCLLIVEECNLNGNYLGVLPQSLSQVLKLYWTNDGNKAFFWDDNTTDIYVLDGNQGAFQVFKKEVLKVRNSFLVSPDGKNIVFEIQKNDYETDLVMMDSSSGDIFKFDIPVPGAKYVSQWIDDHTVLFWDEINEGKGYLVDLKVYTLNTIDQSVQPFDIGRDWLKTTVPVFSPDRKLMAFSDAAQQLVIRNSLSAAENSIDVATEKFLWFADSQGLMIYSQNKEMFSAKSDGNEIQKIYTFAENEYLEDWIWLTDNEHLLLITTDDNGNRQIGSLSLLEKTFTPLNLSLLDEYDPISFSFRP